MDIWTTKKCKDSFIGITCHMLNTKTRKRENYRISCRLMDCPHTGLNIAKFMKNIFMEYGINGKMFRVLSDNASSMIKAVRDLKSLNDLDVEVIEESSEDESDTSDDDEMSRRVEEDSEPDDVEEDTEEADVEEQVRSLEMEENEHIRAFREASLRRNPCIVHKLQLPIQKLISSKQYDFKKHKFIGFFQ